GRRTPRVQRRRGGSRAVRSMRRNAPQGRSETNRRMLLEHRTGTWRPPAAGSVGVALVGVPGRLLWIMRAVVDLDDDGLFVGDRRAVHVALGIAVEASGGEHGLGRRVFVAALEADHELVRRMEMRLRNAGTLVEADERDRGPGLLVPPQHLLVNALERFLAPRNVLGLDKNLFEIGGAGRKVHVGLVC